MGSPLKPTRLNKVIGKQREINRKILIFQFLKNKCSIIKIIEYQQMLKNAVE